LLLRQQAQSSALAARDAGAGAQAEAAQLPQAPLLDARAALLAAAARPLAVPAAIPAQSGSTPASATRGSASEALAAALGALQGQAADSSAAPLAAKDSASLLADSQRQPADAGIAPGFRSVLANGAAPQAGDTVQLSGSPEQWQQPLRSALGDRLQLQLARNDERAVIRLEPPNMGSVEISVRHSGGALQINISASHSEVLRQLNTIGDTVRQDLSQRQFGEVAVTVSSSNARSLADGGQRQQEAHQQREQQRQPGRALDDGDAGATTFAMLGERE
jgi:flagellar hook-length control protein FliK